MLNSLLHRAFALGIKSRCGLIQQQHRRIPQDRPRNRYALLLSPRKHHAALSKLGVIALAQSFNKLVCRRSLGCSLNLSIACLWAAKANVVARAAREDHRVLRHHSDLAAEIFPLHLAQVHTVELDRPLLWIIKPLDHLHYSGFASP